MAWGFGTQVSGDRLEESVMRGGAPMSLDAIVSAARGAIGSASRAKPLGIYACSSCGDELVGPRPGVCLGCRATEAELERAHQLAERALIPPRFRWASLDLVPWFAPPGICRHVAHPEAVRRAREFRGRLLVLRGASDAGKSSLGCAVVRAGAERGRSAVVVRCADIAPDAPSQERAHALLVRAAHEQVVLLDDLGSDLSGAPAGEGLASYRGARARRLIRDLYDVTGVGTAERMIVITTGLDDRTIERSYGDDILRRMLRAEPGTLELTLGAAR